MKHLAAITICLLGFGAFAASPAALMVPQYGDPVRQTGNTKTGQGAFTLCTGFVGSEGATSFTAMVWVKWTPRTTFPVNSQMYPFVLADFTTEAARSTTEGGPTLTNLSPVSDTANLPLTNGRWSANCLPSSYACPDTITDMWQYGCYCFNITTDTGLTLNVGGEELYIPATNGMVRNIIAASASRAVSIVAESASANVKFGIAEMPLVQFVGSQSDGYSSNNTTPGTSAGGLKASEWRLFVLKGSISGGNAVADVDGYNSIDKLTGVNHASQALWHTRTTFAKNSRFRFMVASPLGLKDSQGNEDTFDIYGFKCFRGTLSDTLIQTMRDQDVATMRRRGMIQ